MPQHGAPDNPRWAAWREILDKHQSALADDLSGLLSTDIAEAVSTAVARERAQSGTRIASACDEARRNQSESLNQSLRRLRLATSGEETLRLLNESCSRWAQRVVVLTFSATEETGTTAIAAAATGLAGGGELDFPLSAAPAICAAIGNREPLVTLASAEQISPALASAFGSPDDDGGDSDNDGYDKAFLFPLVARQSSVAMLIAGGKVDPAQLELLSEAAAMRLEALQLETLRPPTSDRRSPASPSWEDLDPGEQKLHLQAQRTARVRVAEMRLYNEDAVRRGQAGADLYQALQTRIDAARREFLQNYLAHSTTMVDYLHLELIRSVAGGDAKLLGTGYPGPLV